MEIKKVFQQLDEEFSFSMPSVVSRCLASQHASTRLKGHSRRSKSIPAFQQLDDAVSHFNVLCHVKVLGITANFHKIRYALIV